MKCFNLKYGIQIALLLTLLAALPACENDGPSAPPEPEPEAEFTGAVSSEETGIIAKGATRQFTADTDAEVIWTVDGSAGTTIDETGLLSVGKSEANITLKIRAESDGAVLGTAAVKVKGWKDISEQLSAIFSSGYGVGGSRDTGITAAAYGGGVWVIAGHSVEDWKYPAVAWSDDDGETWHKAETPLSKEEYCNSIVYGGPPGKEKFVIGGYLGNAIYSTDGKKWSRSDLHFKSWSGSGTSRNPLRYTAYGEVKDGGLFVTSNGTSEFAYSSDGEKWTKGDGKLSLLCYGAGLVEGGSVNMFTAAADGGAVYSVNGIDWTQDEAGGLHFIPAVPDAGYNNIPVQAMDTKPSSKKSSMFYQQIFTGKHGTGNFSTMSESGKYVPCPDDSSVYVYQSAYNSGSSYKYANYVNFIVPGGGKYLAVGAGYRAAIAHAEAFE